MRRFAVGSPFRMLKPARAFSHGVMNAGGSCGACHDGRKSFGVQDDKACSNCHVGRAEEASGEAGKAATQAAAPTAPQPAAVDGRKP